MDTIYKILRFDDGQAILYKNKHAGQLHRSPHWEYIEEIQAPLHYDEDDIKTTLISKLSSSIMNAKVTNFKE